VGTNKLEALPSLQAFLPHSNSLQNLNLEFNSIEFLPEDLFCVLPNLAQLCIRGNKLKQLPQSILQTERLHTLDLA